MIIDTITKLSFASDLIQLAWELSILATVVGIVLLVSIIGGAILSLRPELRTGTMSR